MKKALLNLNKIFLLFLFAFSINNNIFAQEKEAIETSKELHEYMENKKLKNKHTLKISYKINVYIEKFKLHSISNRILAKLGYFDGNDLALTEFIKEKQIPEIKKSFDKNNVKYDDIIIFYNENYLSNKLVEFKISVLFTLIGECTINYEYTNFNSVLVNYIENSIISDAKLNVNKLHSINGLKNVDITIDDTECKWKIISDKTE